MGKQSSSKKKKKIDKSPKSQIDDDKDDETFTALARELRDEGNKLFQRRDHLGAMSKYEKALTLLPRNAHCDETSYLRSNLAACHMQMGLGSYPRAILECSHALEATPGYSKALLKRARCYEALNRLDLAWRDVSLVLTSEPRNAMALEVSDRIRVSLESKGLVVASDSDKIELPVDYVEPESKVSKKKDKNFRKKKMKSKVMEAMVEEKDEEEDEEEEKEKSVVIELPKKSVKLVLGEDIRWAQVGENCSVSELREAVSDRFPGSKAVLIKYRDREGDLVTITSDEELRLAEQEESSGSIRFYLVEVENPERDPILCSSASESSSMIGASSVSPSPCVEDWIIQFARMFKSHVGFESDSYLSVHELGMKVYSEAMEETVTSDEAQCLFDSAGEKFQELTAVALLNWGNVHVSRARKSICFDGDETKESVVSRIKSAFDRAQNEYSRAGERYDEAIRMKPDFFEAYLALGQQRFERAKLSWYQSISEGCDLATEVSTEILKLYNEAEDNMEKGTQMWEEQKRMRGLSEQRNGVKSEVKMMGLEGLFKDVSAEEEAEQALNMSSQINLLWGTMLYERSIVEFRLGLPIWHETLEVSIEKFGLAGASSTDIAVMVKNHCSNDTAVEGFGFKIDEIVQAWNEMYEAKKLRNGVPSFRLEPLLRRRVSKLYYAFEHV